jgi:hypothetical protein
MSTIRRVGHDHMDASSRKISLGLRDAGGKDQGQGKKDRPSMGFDFADLSRHAESLQSCEPARIEDQPTMGLQ